LLPLARRALILPIASALDRPHADDDSERLPRP
jgi:hypothetical protein